MGDVDNITGLEIEEACARLLERVNEKKDDEYDEISILDCLGRVLYEDIISQIDVPSFPKSAMDGYAVRGEDTYAACTDKPLEFAVAGELVAGDYREYEYKPNTAIRVMTGAYVPQGYDAVIKQEDVIVQENNIIISKAVSAFSNYCRQGEDIEKGSQVLKKGTLLNSLHVGILASIGIAYVKVKKPVRAAIISTGSEVIAPGEKCSKGKIYNNSAYILHSRIKKAGLRVVLMSIIPDDENLLSDAILNIAKKADIVITTGAVSVGKRDIVPEVLNRIGAEVIFKRANIQPGTPTIGSIYNHTVILSLSGNPYAALANFDVYFYPLAAKLMGCPELDSKIGTGIMSHDYHKANKHRRLLRAYVNNGYVTLPEQGHAASVISNLVSCNCYIELEAERTLKKGDSVKIRYADF